MITDVSSKPDVCLATGFYILIYDLIDVFKKALRINLRRILKSG